MNKKTREKTKAIAKIVLLESLADYFFKKEAPDTVHFPLDLLFPEERRIASIMGGLQTSFGIKLWERLAKEIAGKNGFIIKNNKDVKMPKKIPEDLSRIINTWTRKRRSEGANLSLEDYVKELKKGIPSISKESVEFVKLSKGEGIDLLLEKEGVEYAFDIKTVQINAGMGTKLNNTLMEWYAFRLFQDSTADFRARIVFPYNPYNDGEWWKRDRGKLYPLDESNDIFFASDFWDFLGGQGTLDAIKEAFTELSHEEKHVIGIYKEMIRDALTYGKALILASKFSCALQTNKEKACEVGAELEWKCNQCKKTFIKTYIQLKRMQKCPECKRKLRDPLPAS